MQVWLHAADEQAPELLLLINAQQRTQVFELPSALGSAPLQWVSVLASDADQPAPAIPTAATPAPLPLHVELPGRSLWVAEGRAATASGRDAGSTHGAPS